MKVVDEKSLGARLQIARQQAGLTQQAMCQKANLSYSTLAKIERGAIKSPSIFTIRSIAQVLGTSLDELVGFDSKKSSSTKHKSKSGVKFIYFDINGCLVRFFHRAFTAIAEDYQLTPDVIESAFWKYNDDVCTGEMTVEEFNEQFAKDLKVEKIDWEDYYLKAVEPIEEMHELVKWASENYLVGLMSNIGKGFIKQMQNAGLLPDVKYDAIVDSSEVGEIKPNPKVYQVAMAKAGVAAEEILLIDDTRGNLIPAQKAGWHVMWFNDYDSQSSAKQARAALEPASS
ncbi:HAD-IA family hydrolase [Candidatus Saccharibacteria bacterium]|nr:HAD-IA family hydrolase [Candidatus Saccharibacteria bacterium]